LIAPGGLLLLAAWALHRDEPVRNAMAAYTGYFCIGALAAAALLSWYHNYVRILCLTVATGLAVWSFARLSTNPEFPLFIPALLLPLNFILFAWIVERGVLTISGLMKLGVLGLQVAGVFYLLRYGGSPLASSLVGTEAGAAWTWMPSRVLLLFAAAALFLLVLAFRRQTKIGPALLWALAAVFVAMNQEKPESIFLYAGTAGMVLMLGVLEHGYDIAYLDELTGLPSRRAFNEALLQLKAPYAIAMCDVDLFKRFNDTYGHDVGDQVLRMIASRLTNVQGGGRVFRHGGEEFAILFRRQTAAEVHSVVESLRDAVAGTDFVLRDSRDRRNIGVRKPAPERLIKITISIGS
jgi:diguanylate cyclase (GGDEF)-like protein